MWSSAQRDPWKVIGCARPERGHDEERVKQDRVLGVPNVGETERRRFSSEDKLRGGEGGGGGKERSDSGIF